MSELTKEQHATLKALRKRYHAETAGEGVMQQAYQTWLEERYLELQSQLAELGEQLEFTRLERDNRTSAYGIAVKQIGELRQRLAASQERERIMREALGTIARNEDPDAHWSFDIATAALRDLPEEKPASIEPLYYIQNNGYCGNSLTFWRIDGKGYTRNLDDAWKLPKTQAEAICRDRPNEDFMWPVEVIDRATERHCNSEKLRDENGNWIEPIPVGQSTTEVNHA